MSVRFLSTAVVAGSVALVAATPAAAIPGGAIPGGAIPGARQSVFVVGDSLTVGSQSSIKSSLRTISSSVGIDAKVGRYTAEGIAKLRTPPARRSVIWVVALGTNDGPSASTMRRNIKTVMRLAGDNRSVMWVNIVRPGGYSKVNRALRKATHRYPRLSVLDWAGYITQHKNYLLPDQVHLSATGYRIRGAMIASAVRALVRAREAPS